MNCELFKKAFVEIRKTFLCAASAQIHDDKRMEYLVQLILLVQPCVHDMVHGRLTHLVHYVIIEVTAEESMLNAFVHKLS